MSDERKNLIIDSDESNPNIYFSNMVNYADKFKKNEKNFIFLG